MRFGSVCSGIEAASVAWEPLGWQPMWFSEVEPFPSAVLAHHWPHVVNHGDMTKLAEQAANDNVAPPDVLVGGTPCQAFSVAGARKGLEDERGILTIKYVELANEIDAKRIAAGDSPAVIVWENVPGVLSDKGNAFGAFLGLLAGESCELQPPGKRWQNAGFVHGPQRTIAWRVLDAQYFGVAQRRRRVFVVASAATGFDPGAILFEREGVRRDIAPSREAGQEAPRDIANCIRASGTGTARIGDQTGQDNVVAPYQKVSHCLNAGGMGRIDYETESFVVHGTQDPIVSDNRAHAPGRNNGGENAVLAFSAKDYGGDVTKDLTPTLRVGNSNKSHANSGNWMAGFPIPDKATRYEGKTGIGSGNGVGIGKPSAPSPTLTAGDKHSVGYEMAVRRLTPTECERLQGFPDGWTAIPWRGKPADDCPDGPRYKTIGNSMAVPVMRWIGQRIDDYLKTKPANDNREPSHAKLATR